MPRDERDEPVAGGDGEKIDGTNAWTWTREESLNEMARIAAIAAEPYRTITLMYLCWLAVGISTCVVLRYGSSRSYAATL